MDYETFGEHKKAASGIFSFLEEFVLAVVRHGKFVFATPSEISRFLSGNEVIQTDHAISWADEARDLSAWLGNNMQRDAFGSLYKLHDSITGNGDVTLINTYRHLQTSDHFYYMATKNGADGSVHQYFSPYNSPYEAFMNFMNIVTDLELRIKEPISQGLPTMVESADTLFVGEHLHNA